MSCFWGSSFRAKHGWLLDPGTLCSIWFSVGCFCVIWSVIVFVVSGCFYYFDWLMITAAPARKGGTNCSYLQQLVVTLKLGFSHEETFIHFWAGGTSFCSHGSHHPCSKFYIQYWYGGGTSFLRCLSSCHYQIDWK